MEVWIAWVLLALVIGGIVLLGYGMGAWKWKNARWGIVLLTVTALTLALYLLLTDIFVSSIP